MKRMLRSVVLFQVLILALGMEPLLAAESISGKACYRYSNLESIVEAREITMTMAKRDALEGYRVFVESTTVLHNATIKNDIVTGITSGLLKNVEVIAASENRDTQEICREIRAEVEPVEVRKHIEQRKIVLQGRYERQELPTGLYESNQIRVIKSESVDCHAEFSFEEGLIEGSTCYKWRFVCKVQGDVIRPLWKYTWIDNEGLPFGHSYATVVKESLSKDSRSIFSRTSESYLAVPASSKPPTLRQFAIEMPLNSRLVCSLEGEIRIGYVPLPPDSVKYSLEIVE